MKTTVERTPKEITITSDDWSFVVSRNAGYVCAVSGKYAGDKMSLQLKPTDARALGQALVDMADSVIA